MSRPPTGTVTFLFTDMEASTRLLQEIGQDEYQRALRTFLARQYESIEQHGGVVMSTSGEGVFSAFERASAAVSAALEAQRALGCERWPDGCRLKARMGMHTGEANVADDDYVGLAVNIAARICDAGHGGQVLFSRATRDLIDHLPGGSDAHAVGSHRLKDVADPVELYQLVHDDLGAEFPPLRTASGLMTNLPVRATSFVGRDALVQEIAKTLTDARVVTLIGVGGVGKTSVALRVAEELIPEFPDGVWLMELGSVTNGESLPDVLARILNVQQAPGRSMLQTLIDVLRAKRVLLVLDNCEHLLRDCAELAEAFVHACPDLRILATSREGLAIEGEYSRPIPSLGVPDEGAPLDELVTVDAVRLFVDRARAGRPDFEIVSDDAPAVIELCRRLDGVPLALELAAARVRSMSVGEIAARLGERFRLLKGGRRTATERHQTLRGTVDWSYDLLGETERLMFDRLAVFVGGFRLEAAEAVCAADDLDIYDIPDLIADLVDKSMLIATTSSEGHTRYEMLETLRSYGLERLEARGESDSHRRRFAEYYADLVERVGEGVRGPEEGRYVRLTFEEWDNFRSAHQWTVDAGDVDTGLRLVVGLAPFAYDRLTNEAGRWALAASEVPGARDHPLFAEARGEVSIIESQIGELRRAEELVSDLPEGSPTWIKKNTFGIVALYEGRLEDSIAYVADGIEETEAAGDHYNASYFRLCSALAKSYAGRDREEIDIDVAAMERHAEVLGNPRAFAWLAYVRGEVLVEADPEAAVPHLEQAIALAAEAENRFVQSVSRVSLASIRGRHGDPRTALETFGVIISDWRRSGNWIHQWTAVRNLVELFDRLGRVRPAVVLYGASEASETSAPLFGAHRERLDAVVERAKHALGEAEYDAMYRRGCEMPDDEALMFALEEIDSALAELGEG